MVDSGKKRERGECKNLDILTAKRHAWELIFLGTAEVEKTDDSLGVLTIPSFYLTSPQIFSTNL